ncbi:hypothetical protein SAMN02910368_00784 [Lachnospiraceae bacterium G11]|nr:hypothetical protein SAMN02910368_00784 [Lachnospiraceae bacterium G11]
MKRLLTMILATILVVSACVFVVPQSGMKVKAVGEKTITGLGTGAIGNPASGAGGWSYVYYGKYYGSDMKFRVLDTAAIEFNANTTMLLDCDSTIINKPHYLSSPYSNSWAGSEINAWLNGSGFYNNATNVFTPQEKAAIVASSKSDFSNDGPGRNSLDSQNLTGEHVFLLDAKEATRESYGYASNAGDDATRVKSGTYSWWWLRSPDYSNGSLAGGVDDDGYVNYHDVLYSSGVSPALNVNLSSVIFSSEISDGYKLTVKDANMTIAQTGGSDVTRAGNVVTVPYTISGSNAGEATQVSVLITDTPYSAGTATSSGFSYQKLNVTTWGTEGTGTFTIPAAYANQTCGSDYYAYILAEDVNTGTATDYASVPVGITIPADSGSGVSTPASTTTPGPVIITADEAGNEEPSVSTKKDWLEILNETIDEAINEAIKEGTPQTIYLKGVTGLPITLMRKLKDNPQITLDMSYSYEGVDYHAVVPGKSVIVDDTIPWYGPLYLNKYYSR